MEFFKKMSDAGFTPLANIVGTSRWERVIAREDGKAVVRVKVTACKRHTRFTVDYVIDGVKDKTLLRKIVCTYHTDLRIDSTDPDLIEQRRRFFSDLHSEPLSALNDEDYINWFKKIA